MIAAFPSAARAAPDSWAMAVAELTAPVENVPQPGGVVFVGSSSIKRWATLQEDFPGVPVVNRGFGGSELSDAVYYFEKLVAPAQPSVVVLYSGENDLQGGKSPEDVLAQFKAFCAKMKEQLPAAKLVYISIKPSPARWKLREKMQQANALIAAECAANPSLAFVDIYPGMLDAQGEPNAEFFVTDKLHLSPAGYKVWVARLLTVLSPAGTAAAAPAVAGLAK